MAIEGALFKQGAIWNPVVRRGLVGAAVGAGLGAAYQSISDSPNAAGNGAMLGGILGGLSGMGKLSRMNGAAELIGEKGNRLNTITEKGKGAFNKAGQWFEKTGLGAKTDDAGMFVRDMAEGLFGKQEWYTKRQDMAQRAFFGAGKGAVLGAGVGAAYGLVSDNDSMFGGAVKGAMLGAVAGGIRYGSSAKAYNARINRGVSSAGAEAGKTGVATGKVASNRPIDKVYNRLNGDERVTYFKGLPTEADLLKEADAIAGIPARTATTIASNKPVQKQGFWSRLFGKNPKKNATMTHPVNPIPSTVKSSNTTPITIPNRPTQESVIAQDYEEAERMNKTYKPRQSRYTVLNSNLGGPDLTLPNQQVPTTRYNWRGEPIEEVGNVKPSTNKSKRYEVVNPNSSYYKKEQELANEKIKENAQYKASADKKAEEQKKLIDETRKIYRERKKNFGNRNTIYVNPEHKYDEGMPITGGKELPVRKNLIFNFE